MEMGGGRDGRGDKIAQKAPGQKAMYFVRMRRDMYPILGNECQRRQHARVAWIT